jgi:hypothetical protein
VTSERTVRERKLGMKKGGTSLGRSSLKHISRAVTMSCPMRQSADRRRKGKVAAKARYYRTTHAIHRSMAHQEAPINLY